MFNKIILAHDHYERSRTSSGTFTSQGTGEHFSVRDNAPNKNGPLHVSAKELDQKTWYEILQEARDLRATRY